MTLTNTACKNAKPKEKSYRKSDSGGMYLEIMPNGSKYWRMKYRYLGKEKRLALGVYPEVTLAEARDKRDAARKLLAKEIDPSIAKKQEKRQAVMNAANTFEAVAREWYEVKKENWSEGYAKKIRQGLEKNIFPFIGSRPIAEITPPELLDCLKKIEKRGSHDISGRTKQFCGQIFRYGIQTGKCERDAAADLKDALKTRKKEHFRTIDANQLPDFLKALERNEARIYERTRRAVRLSLLTFLRPKEIRMARWQDINIDKKIWIVPAHIMKSKRDHIVPLSKQSIAVLEAQKEELCGLNTEWVFPSQIRLKDPMSDGTVNKAIKRLGYGKDMVAHGFRALARTTIRENLHYESEIIEKQLAHQSKDPLGEAYDRTQFLDQRKIMLQDWANYLDAVASEEKVIIGDFRKRT